MIVPDCPNADKTVSVRVISNCEKSFHVPDIVRKHFRVPAESGESHLEASSVPPETVSYNSIAIALFQKIDGLDVCIFCMFVPEYDGEDEYDSSLDSRRLNKGRGCTLPTLTLSSISVLDRAEQMSTMKCWLHILRRLVLVVTKRLTFGHAHRREETHLSFGTTRQCRELPHENG